MGGWGWGWGFGFALVMIPPWWIIYGVTPEGAPVQSGSHTETRFSEAQQKQFHCNEVGRVEVANREAHEAAIEAHKASKQASH